MKLVYEYINLSKNGILKEQDINITGRYNFCFNKDFKNPIIFVSEKNEFIENFFDEENIILDITAIVGENGSGKTTIMEHISSKNYNSLSMDDWIQEEKKIRIKIYERNLNGKLKYIVVHNLSLLNIELKLSFLTPNTFDYSIVLEDSDISIIYITSDSTINKRNGFGNSEIRYYTTADAEEALDYKIFTWFRVDNNTYIEVLKAEFDKVVCKQLIKKTYRNIKVINILIDTNCNFFDTEINQVEMYFYYMFLVFDDTVSSDIRNLINKNAIDLYPHVYQKRDGHVFKEAHQTLVSNLLAEIFIVFENHRDEILSDIAKNNRREDSLLIIDQIIQFLNVTDEKYKKYAKLYLQACRDLKEFLIMLSDEKKMNFDKKYVFTIQLDINSKLIKVLIRKWYKNEWSIVFRYLQLNIHELSGGEESLLYLYTSIHEAVNLNPLKETILLLMDEVDVRLHPLWERKFLDNLINNLKKIAKIKNKKFQIIYTTHSPITLSDMPSSNVLLVKDLQIYNNTTFKTFSSNIYNLYRETFFLGENTDGIATIGSFAQNKMNSILGRINNKYENCQNKKKQIEDDKKTIDMIGEPIIKNTLSMYLENNIGGDKY